MLGCENKNRLISIDALFNNKFYNIAYIIHLLDNVYLTELYMN